MPNSARIQFATPNYDLDDYLFANESVEITRSISKKEQADLNLQGILQNDITKHKNS